MENIGPRGVQEKVISDEYVWSAIRYLDPDKNKENSSSLLLGAFGIALSLGILILILLRTA